MLLKLLASTLILLSVTSLARQHAAYSSDVLPQVKLGRLDQPEYYPGVRRRRLFDSGTQPPSDLDEGSGPPSAHALNSDRPPSPDPSDHSLFGGDLSPTELRFDGPETGGGGDDPGSSTDDSGVGGWSVLWFIVAVAFIAVLAVILRRACTKQKPLPRMRVHVKGQNASGKNVNPYPEGYTPPASVGNYNWSKQGESDRQLEVGYHDTRGGWEDSRAEGEDWERSRTVVGKPAKASSMSMVRKLSSHFMNKVELAISSPTKLRRSRSIASPDPRQPDFMIQRDASALSIRLLEDELEGELQEPGLPGNKPPPIQISCPLSPQCRAPAVLGSPEGRKKQESPITVHIV